MFAGVDYDICGFAVTAAPFADRVICEVAVTADPVAAWSGYHAIGDYIIFGVAVTDATAAAWEVYHSCNYRVWSIHGWKSLLWLWVGCLAVMGDIQRLKL